MTRVKNIPGSGLRALALGHADRAAAAYADHKLAHAAQDAYEIATVERMGSAQAAAQALSDTEAPRDWTYRVLVGKRTWFHQLAMLETAMAEMYANLAMMEERFSQ